jgi:hypothetical protein
MSPLHCRYELQIEDIHLLDTFGGVKHVAPRDYFNAALQASPSSDGDNNSPPTGGSNSGAAALVGGLCGALGGALAAAAVLAAFVMFQHRALGPASGMDKHRLPTYCALSSSGIQE